jgi:hypothetical protein
MYHIFLELPGRAILPFEMPRCQAEIGPKSPDRKALVCLPLGSSSCLVNSSFLYIVSISTRLLTLLVAVPYDATRVLGVTLLTLSE